MFENVQQLSRYLQAELRVHLLSESEKAGMIRDFQTIGPVILDNLTTYADSIPYNSPDHKLMVNVTRGLFHRYSGYASVVCDRLGIMKTGFQLPFEEYALAYTMVNMPKGLKPKGALLGMYEKMNNRYIPIIYTATFFNYPSTKSFRDYLHALRDREGIRLHESDGGGRIDHSEGNDRKVFIKTGSVDVRGEKCEVYTMCGSEAFEGSDTDPDVSPGGFPVFKSSITSNG